MKKCLLLLLCPGSLGAGLITLPPLNPSPAGGYPVMDAGANFKLEAIRLDMAKSASAIQHVAEQIGTFAVVPEAPLILPVLRPPSYAETIFNTPVEAALDRSPDGIRLPVRSSFQLGPESTPIVRQSESYAPPVMLLAAYDAYQQTVAETDRAREELEREQLRLLDALRTALTQAETDKLAALLHTVSLRLATVAAQEDRARQQFESAATLARVADQMDAIAINEELRARGNGIFRSLISNR